MEITRIYKNHLQRGFPFNTENPHKKSFSDDPPKNATGNRVQVTGKSCMEDRPPKMEVRVFSGHRVNGFPSAFTENRATGGLRSSAVSPVAGNGCWPTNTRLQAVGFHGSRVLGCGSHRFELAGRGSRLRVLVVRLLGSAGAP